MGEPWVPPGLRLGRLAGQDAGLSHRRRGFDSRSGHLQDVRDRGVRTEAHGVASAADRVRVPAVASTGLPVAGNVACNHRGGVRFPGAPSTTRSRTRPVARPGCLPGETGSTPAGSAPRRSSADPSTSLRGWGTEVRILPARCTEHGEARQLRRRSRRLQVCAGIRARDSARRNPAFEQDRRQADWAGAALIQRSSVVRFHGRRSPRSSAEEQRASTPRDAGSIPAGEHRRGGPMVLPTLLVVGETGHPTDFGRRRSQVRILPTRSSLSPRESGAR